jgi:hypothetical protein
MIGFTGKDSDKVGPGDYDPDSANQVLKKSVKSVL